MPFESGSKPRRTLRSPLEVVSNPISGRRGPLEVVPADFPAARRLGSRSTPISRLRHASRKIFGGAAASPRTDIRSCHKYSHFLAVSIQTE